MPREVLEFNVAGREPAFGVLFCNATHEQFVEYVLQRGSKYPIMQRTLTYTAEITHKGMQYRAEFQPRTARDPPSVHFDGAKAEDIEELMDEFLRTTGSTEVGSSLLVKMLKTPAHVIGG